MHTDRHKFKGILSSIATHELTLELGDPSVISRHAAWRAMQKRGMNRAVIPECRYRESTERMD